MIDARNDDHVNARDTGDEFDLADARRVRVERLREHRARYLAQLTERTRQLPTTREVLLRRVRLATVATAVPFLLLATLSAVADTVHLINGGPAWASTGYWAAVVALVFGLVTAVGGATFALLAPRGSGDRRIAAILAAGSAGVLALVGMSWSAWGDVINNPNVPAVVLGVMAGGIAVVIGGLAGDLLDARRVPAAAPAYVQPARRRRAVLPTDDDAPDERLVVRA